MVKEGGLPITGGILTIVAAVLSLILGFSMMSFFFIEILYSIVTWWLGIAGFAFGLASGVLMIKRRSLGLSLIGMIILLVVGILPLLWGFIYPEGFVRESLIRTFYDYGVPIISFAILSIIFAVVSRKKFT